MGLPQACLKYTPVFVCILLFSNTHTTQHVKQYQMRFQDELDALREQERVNKKLVCAHMHAYSHFNLRLSIQALSSQNGERTEPSNIFEVLLTSGAY